MSRISWVALGLVLLTGALPAAMALWYILPAGRYPSVVVGLPALPLLWAGLICLKRAGWPVDRFVSERPWATGCLVSVLFLVALVVAMAVGLF